MRFTCLVLGFSLVAHLVAVRLLFLAPTRLGWINYYANVGVELFERRLHWPRGRVEFLIALIGMGFLGVGGASWAAVGWGGLVLALLELWVRWQESRLLSEVHTQGDYQGLRGRLGGDRARLGRAYPSPSTHPELTLNLVGPFFTRWPRYSLGTLVAGRVVEIELIIGNHTRVPTQTAVQVQVDTPAPLVAESPGETALPHLRPADCHRLRLRWRVGGTSGSGVIRLRVSWGTIVESLQVRFDGCVEAASATVARAEIQRYPGACRSAFAWRGDMDLYDESTLQSIEGLEVTFGLASLYRMPQTMYLSSRLCLDAVAAAAWAEHYGVDRGASQIPKFIEWMRAKVDLRHTATYPFESAKPYLIELGNHGHLHYGTEASGSPENGWSTDCRMGSGVYPWVGEDRTSLGEQRDNAREMSRMSDRCFGYQPRSWAKPDSTFDHATPAAMEAAGCEVVSDSDVGTRGNVLLQPPPHHPQGTSVVELTKRYPGDPQHIFHIAMIRFWLHRAHRRSLPVIFMCHQHMRQFDGWACTRLTENVLRYALHRFHGDLHVNTVFGIGKYWREVLSPQTRRVTVTVDADRITIENRSDESFSNLPVEVTFRQGGHCTLLVDVPAGGRVEVHEDGRPVGSRSA